jgi:hypothetical protein
MASQEGFFTNKGPFFDRTNYEFWSIRMKTYLLTLGFDISQSVVNGYITPTTPPIDVVEKNPNEHNGKSKNSILCGLLEYEFVKLMHCVLEK